MQIGRKIYYDKAIGNVLVDTGERSGNVVETTIEQDFAAYFALAERVPETVGMLQLQYGEHADNFARYLYRIDPATETIIWDMHGAGMDLDQFKVEKFSSPKTSLRQLLTRSVNFVSSWRNRQSRKNSK
ncbi:hypothetical protein [Tumebacillus lipolyticus]|uniref:Uncharacterized protein n=1 Tax=Tumebacillus lipolyticus TaxID=1280370 RepID=A0ABW5A0R7_9BACL